MRTGGIENVTEEKMISSLIIQTTFLACVVLVIAFLYAMAMLKCIFKKSSHFIVRIYLSFSVPYCELPEYRGFLNIPN